MLFSRKEHLTTEGFNKVLAIKASINKGLYTELGSEFNVTPVTRPAVKFPENIAPHWLAGFVSAECCFMIKAIKNTTKLGTQIV